MLVLTRQQGEQIHIGDDIVIVFKRIYGKQCVVGIDAPKEIRILRSELRDEYDSREQDCDV